MPSSSDQDSAFQAKRQLASTVGQGFGQAVSLEEKERAMVSHGADCTARSPGPEDLLALQTEWIGRHAKLWYGMLQQPGDQPASGTKAKASDQGSDRPALGGSPMFDYLQAAHRINANCLESMVAAAPVGAELDMDRVRALTGQVVDAMAPSNFLDVDSQPVESNYPDIRDTLKSGDIVVASKGNIKSFNNFLSLLIRVFTASSYSHVGVVVKLGNRCFVVEATPPVVRLFPLSKLDSFYVIKMEQDWSGEDENRLFEYVGLPYSDWNSIVSYFTRRPLANGKLQCAQLVSSFYRWPNLLRPEQIVRYAQETLGKQMIFVN